MFMNIKCKHEYIKVLSMSSKIGIPKGNPDNFSRERHNS